MENRNKPLRVCAFGVHADDCEYGLGGTALLLARAGCEVKFFCMTSSQHVTPGAPEPPTLPGVSRELFPAPGAEILTYTEAAVLALTERVRAFRPDIAFVMWPRDNHMEHAAAARVQLDALFRAGGVREAYAYEVGPLQTMTQFGMPDLTVDITSVLDELYPVLDGFFETARGAEAFREEKEVSARFRGYSAYSGFRYGEAFRVVKLPEGEDDFLLRGLLPGKFRWGGVGGYWIGRQYYQ